MTKHCYFEPRRPDARQDGWGGVASQKLRVHAEQLEAEVPALRQGGGKCLIHLRKGDIGQQR